MPADYRFRFAQRFEEIKLAVPGGTRDAGRWTLDALRFRQPDPRGLVFYLHGNGGVLTTWTTGLEFYRRINYDRFLLDYRGYGKSTGRIAHRRGRRTRQHPSVPGVPRRSGGPFGQRPWPMTFAAFAGIVAIRMQPPLRISR